MEDISINKSNAERSICQDGKSRDFPGRSVVRLRLPIEGVSVLSVVGELGSYMSPGQKTETQNRSNLVTNSVKTPKLVHIKLSLKKKKGKS